RSRRRQGESIADGARNWCRRRGGVCVRGVRLVAATPHRDRARSPEADDGSSSRNDLHVSSRRHVVAGCPRCATRLQRHDGYVLFRASRLSSCPGQARAGRWAGDGSMTGRTRVRALERAALPAYTLAIALLTLFIAIAITACRE